MAERSSVLDLWDYRSLARRRWRWLVAVPLVVTSLAALATVLQRPVYASSAEVLILTESSRTLFPFTASTAEQLTRRPFAELQFLEADRYRSGLPSPDAVQAALVPIDADQDLADSDVIRFTAQGSSARVATDLADAHAQRYLSLRHEQDLSQLRVQLERLDVVLADLSSDLDAGRPETEAQRQAASLERGSLAQALAELESSRGAGQLHNPATVPSAPISPDPMRNLLFGGFAGVVLGLGLAVARELFDGRAFDPQTVVSTIDRPLLGAIGHLPGTSDRSRATVTSNRPDSFRTILNSLWLQGATPPIRTLLVTGPVAGVGTTTTAVGLALVEASRGTEVLLVDTRGGQTRSHLDVATRSGPPDPAAGTPDDADASDPATTVDQPMAQGADHPGDGSPTAGDNGHRATWTTSPPIQPPAPPSRGGIAAGGQGTTTTGRRELSVDELLAELEQVVDQDEPDEVASDPEPDEAEANDADIEESDVDPETNDLDPETNDVAPETNDLDPETNDVEGPIRSDDPEPATDQPLGGRVTPTDTPHLSILDAAPPGEGDVGLPGAGTLTGDLHELGATYELIIIDAAPVFGEIDIRPLTATTDANIVVYDPGRTRLDDLQRAVDVLRGAGAPVAGLVANRVRSLRSYQWVSGAS